MLQLLGRGSNLCDGLTRREWLRAGGLGAFGLALPQLLAARQEAPAGGRGFGRARSCIVLWMTGGPPQHETWDPKPDAPAEIRGPLKPIATNVPGLQVSELMPRVAARCHQLAVLRAMSTDNPSHVGGSYEMLTGTEHPGGKGNDNIVAGRNDSPYFGAVVKRFRPPVAGVPTSVVCPQPIFNVPVYPGQDAGFMGSEHEPWRLTYDPLTPELRVEDFALRAEVPPDRLASRRALLDRVADGFDQMERGAAPARFGKQSREAFSLLAGSRIRSAFDLEREPPAVRDRYGWHPFGRGCLLARRLVEAGVALVQINWHRDQPPDEQTMWDCHYMLPTALKRNMPPMDRGFSALLEDLDQRGLLDETLVVWMGEMGRTPKFESIPKYNEPGRNHWGHVFSVALAGAGVRGGTVYGASDKIGGYPKDGKVTPSDLTATVYHCLGIPPATEIRDRLNRPVPVSTGQPLEALF